MNDENSDLVDLRLENGIRRASTKHEFFKTFEHEHKHSNKRHWATQRNVCKIGAPLARSARLLVEKPARQYSGAATGNCVKSRPSCHLSLSLFLPSIKFMAISGVESVYPRVIRAALGLSP